MIDIARKIRDQLARSPKATFRKTRPTLLEIAVALECAHRALSDSDRRLARARAAWARWQVAGPEDREAAARDIDDALR